MRFSAKRCAYSDMPSFSGHSAIRCIAAPTDFVVLDRLDGKFAICANSVQRPVRALDKRLFLVRAPISLSHFGVNVPTSGKDNFSRPRTAQ